MRKDDLEIWKSTFASLKWATINNSGHLKDSGVLDIVRFGPLRMVVSLTILKYLC